MRVLRRAGATVREMLLVLVLVETARASMMPVAWVGDRVPLAAAELQAGQRDSLEWCEQGAHEIMCRGACDALGCQS